jgi:serine/threonine-protein kinase HipA
MATAYVYIYLEKGPVPAGVLETVGTGRNAGARFRYGNRYLEREDRIAIDPVQLPLPDAGVSREFATEERFNLFNGIRDAAPDGWGRHLMDRAAGALQLSEFDYLLATEDSRVGALAFGQDLNGPQRIAPWPEQIIDGEILDLAGLLEAVKALEAAEDLPSKHQRLLMCGSSLGGARPKATTDYEGRKWIAKFGRNSDRNPICKIEYVTMQLASEVGINIPPIRLQSVLGQDIYLIERFDRIPQGQDYRRIPFISGLTITGAHESESSQQSYRRLADQLRLYGSEPGQDARQLWRRMVFNIFCNNNDDHLRNHGFLWDNRGWRLSPAYDIVANPQVGTERDLAIGVGSDGRRATIANALTQVASFGMGPAECIAIAREMQNVVKHRWEQMCRENRFTELEIERLRSCFIACDEPLPNP